MSGTSVFSDYARYYDLLYREKDYMSEAEYVHRLIRRWRGGASTILELGSGTGKHASLLTDLGYVVHGIDRSEGMLVRACRLAEEQRQRAPDKAAPTFSAGDVCSARLDRTFDVAISLFHVISYQVSNDDVLAALGTARAHLNTGGIFIFDAWYGPAVLTDRPAVRVKRMADDQIDVTRLAEPVMFPNANVVEVNYHVFVRDRASGSVTELREAHEMRYLFMPEIEMFAHDAGFSVLHSEEWLTGHPLGCNTWGACFVLQCL